MDGKSGLVKERPAAACCQAAEYEMVVVCIEKSCLDAISDCALIKIGGFLPKYVP